MADSLTKAQRSQNMAAIAGKHTKPEILVRQFLFSKGLRYRLHRKELPGKPDIAFVGKRIAVFINGCFWHRHSECRFAYIPKSNIDFWTCKFADNTNRDRLNYQKLKDMNWKVIIVWECEIKNRSYESWLLDALV